MGWLKLRYLMAVALMGMASVVSIDAFAKAENPPFAWLSCENGTNYPILAKAVTSEGALVTGYIVIPRRHSIYVRLIPMEHGYRYAGRGGWFDGVRRVAELNAGKNRSMACTVEFDAQDSAK